MSDENTVRPTPTSESGIESLLRARSRRDSKSAATSKGDSDSFSLLSGGGKHSTSTSVNIGSGFLTGGGLKGETSNKQSLLSLITDSTVVASSNSFKNEEAMKSPRPSSYQLCLLSKAMYESNTVCGGTIASNYGDAFCFKERKECQSKTHMTVKHKSMNTDTVYIVGTSNTGSSTIHAYLPERYHYFLGYEGEYDDEFILNLINHSNEALDGITSFEEACNQFNSFVHAVMANVCNTVIASLKKKSSELNDDFTDSKSEDILDLGEELEIEHMRSALEELSHDSDEFNGGSKKSTLKVEDILPDESSEASSLASIDNDPIASKIVDHGEAFGKQFVTNPGKFSALLATQVLRLGHDDAVLQSLKVSTSEI